MAAMPWQIAMIPPKVIRTAAAAVQPVAQALGVSQLLRWWRVPPTLVAMCSPFRLSRVVPEVSPSGPPPHPDWHHAAGPAPRPPGPRSQRSAAGPHGSRRAGAGWPRAGSRPAPGAGPSGGRGALSVVAPTLVRDGTGMEMLGAQVVGGRSRAGLGRRSAQRADLGETGGLRGRGRG